MTLHSRFGASAAHRWMRCPGSIQASEGLPNVSSEFAAEGTLLHGVAEDILRGGGATPAVGLTDEQWDVVRAYVSFVRDCAKGGNLFVENRFKLACHPEFWGTADAVVQKPGAELHVIDLKCGRGVAVEVDYGGRINPQLGFYALGALSLFPGPYGKIFTHVVQPRLGGVKSREVTLDELSKLQAELLRAAANAVADDPRFAAGSHCKFCLARATCPTLRRFVLDTAAMEFANA